VVGPVLGVWTSRSRPRQSGQSDNSLRFGTTVTGLSASAAGNSAFVLVGAVGLGYTMGISALWIAFGFWMGDLLFWYLMSRRLVGRVQAVGVEEISELIAMQSLGSKLLPLRVAACVVTIAVGLYCAAQFLAVGKITVELFGFTEMVAMSIVVVAGLTSIVLGGLASSVIVNVYQAGLMIITAALLLFFIGAEILTSPDSFFVNDSASQLLDPTGGLSIWGVIMFAGTFVLHGFVFATCSPNVLVRITKGNVDAIPRIRWVYMGFMQSLWWLMTLAGVALALLSVPAEDPDSVGVGFAQSVMIAPLLGFFVAGIAAASMSTGEAQLLVIANALTKDLFPDRFKNLSEKGKNNALVIGRIVVAIGILVLLLTVSSQQIGNLVIQSSAILNAAFAIPALMFVFNVSIGGRSMALMMVSGAVATIWVRLQFAPPPGQEIFAGWGAALLVLVASFALRRRNRTNEHGQ
ncbi:MAG: hypothetical protein AAF438_12350, partial [Pseudomonadota bacterium]